MAYFSPVIGGSSLSQAFVCHTLERLRCDGFAKVITGALAPLEQIPFLTMGFTVDKRLQVLSHPLEDLGGPTDSTFALRAWRRLELDQVLAVDHHAFSAFWRFDQASLKEALNATPYRRLRVATGTEDRSRILGYALTGRGGRHGYLQRLAVEPEEQGRGIGRALVLDSLRWVKRWRGSKVMVNTQDDNAGAVRLYHGLGFRTEPTGLAVLSMSLRS